MLFTTLLLSLREIRRHLLRSFLTTLGIIIGVAAVITMVTLGNGVSASVQASISSLGNNTLTVFPSGGRRGGGNAPPQFENGDIQAIRQQVSGVSAVAPQASASALAVRNAQNWNASVTGTSNDYFTAQNLEFAAGRRFTEAEQSAGKSVCVIGDTIRANLFANDDPVGERFRLGTVSCEVVGVLKKRDNAGFTDPNSTVVLPLKTVQRRFVGNQNVLAIQIAVAPGYDTAAVKQSIVGLLRERRHLTPDQPDNFDIFDSAEFASTVSNQMQQMTLFVAAIAAVSLLVGGIGIMNIMLVSVTERTREIGIRLAIGALGKEVLLQFLVEAVALSCLGGLIGVGLAFFASWGLAKLADLPFTFDLSINLISFAISALIGIVFGFFPARRAAALNPIDALRHE
ncbi:ABC transporter permease [Sphingomonas sp. ABOLD]|uniref:Putative ABC transport system permease protein n=1 Tax=Sphingomonas trueperi TaxID=53317 RepID=A0A7X6BDV2_9SPHN|nr:MULTISPECIES: ABC transporter permease [Sphingomonas]NJB98670.1 putative ABC transport system permease protein [Sphingomonas trueperi]RSV45844.1 ABC transporter permease [Sphingomonas sp. ABOLD]